MPTRRRRWYQFDLRTLLVAFAVFAALSAWMASEWRFVQRRNAARKEAYSVKAAFLPPYGPPPYGPARDIPFWRRAMGDEGLWRIYLMPRPGELEAAPDPELLRLKELFTEATVRRLTLSEMVE
jgi:hypothetical protein